MAFFLVKAAQEALTGNMSAAWKTIISGAPEDVQVVEDDAAAAFKIFLAAFGPAEAKTILTSLTTTVQNGIKAGEASLVAGTTVAAQTAAAAAAASLENSVLENSVVSPTPIQAAVAAVVDPSTEPLPSNVASVSSSPSSASGT